MGTIICLTLVVMYFLPWIIVAGQPRGASVFVINLLLGWTFLGWVIALAMAVAPVDKHAS